MVGTDVKETERQAQDVLRRAIAMEHEGKEFFEHASRRMTRKRSKDMFLSLVTQENRHIEILGHELRRLEDGRGWAPLEDAKKGSTDTSGSPVFSKEGVGAVRLEPAAGELEVIDLGMEVEKRSIDYYRDAGMATKDKNARELFNWLVGEEAGHLTILQAERDSRSSSGFYYDDAEFSLETQ